jgi:4-alpha-glucanotransferase
MGDLGDRAYDFLDYLSRAGQSLWQVLPLGPTGYGNSPYACFSSFAGNPLLISMDKLRDEGILQPADLADVPPFSDGRVDYGAVITWKQPLLRRAAARFLETAKGKSRARFDAFCRHESWWLEDYCLFMALKGVCPGAWNQEWEKDIALRVPAALVHWKTYLADEIPIEKAIQYFFFSQWEALREAARSKGIRIIGDIPIFAAPDSADVWTNRNLFLLDAEGKPNAVSGVPPDYFARTGQLWGNPLYDWDRLSQSGFRFWIQRIQAALRLFDYVRVDHFRGFQACWAVPYGEPTAEHGNWVSVPGDELFTTMEKKLGSLPIIAEDLGIITPDVTSLRERFGFPGMRILQFAFDSAEAGVLSADNRFLPHNHTADSIVYTGTHDNDTTSGWFASRSPMERDYLDRYAPPTDREVEWRLIRMALASVCRFAIIPMQDVLGLGSEARMNTPGTTGDENWSWRVPEQALKPGGGARGAGAAGPDASAAADRLRALAALYGRSAQ